MVHLGDVVPDFSCDSTQGRLSFHSYIEGSWAILFSHPSDFTPVCTTELGRAAALSDEFARRGVKLIGLSCDTAESHLAWLPDIEATQGHAPAFPIIADASREIATMWGMLDPTRKDAAGHLLAARALFIIGPDKKMKLSILYPAGTGRNFTEILRCVDSLQLTAQYPVATPADWDGNGDIIVSSSVPESQLAEKFPKGVRVIETPSRKKYLRMTPDPRT